MPVCLFTKKPSPDYTGEDRGPEYLHKKAPPNVEVRMNDGEIEFEIHRKTRELTKHGNKEIDL